VKDRREEENIFRDDMGFAGHGEALQVEALRPEVAVANVKQMAGHIKRIAADLEHAMSFLGAQPSDIDRVLLVMTGEICTEKKEGFTVGKEGGPASAGLLLLRVGGNDLSRSSSFRGDGVDAMGGVRREDDHAFRSPTASATVGSVRQRLDLTFGDI